MPSSVVAGISYNTVNAILRIKFVSGLVYEYKKVPEKVFRDMKKSESKGAYLNQQIKGNYAFKKVS